MFARKEQFSEAVISTYTPPMAVYLCTPDSAVTRQFTPLHSASVHPRQCSHLAVYTQTVLLCIHQQFIYSPSAAYSCPFGRVFIPVLQVFIALCTHPGFYIAYSHLPIRVFAPRGSVYTASQAGSHIPLISLGHVTFLLVCLYRFLLICVLFIYCGHKPLYGKYILFCGVSFTQSCIF